MVKELKKFGVWSVPKILEPSSITKLVFEFTIGDVKSGIDAEVLLQSIRNTTIQNKIKKAELSGNREMI